MFNEFSFSNCLITKDECDEPKSRETRQKTF